MMLRPIGFQCGRVRTSTRFPCIYMYNIRICMPTSTCANLPERNYCASEGRSVYRTRAQPIYTCEVFFFFEGTRVNIFKTCFYSSAFYIRGTESERGAFYTPRSSVSKIM